MPNLDDLVARLRLDSTQFDKGLQGVQVSMGRIQKQTAGVTSGFGALTSRLVALGVVAGAGGVLRDAVGAASDMNETVSKSQVVFGRSQKAVAEFAQTAASSIGQSRQQALDAAATFGNLFVGMGVGQEQAANFSIELTKLASDFASFHNANPQDVIMSLGAAFRGEFDSVQRYVPTINAAAVEQKGLALGLARTTKELDAQDKLMATYTLLTEGAGAAAGDFERTSDGLANQQRTLAANFEDAKASLGEHLLPAITDLVTFLNDKALPAVGDFTDKIHDLFGDRDTAPGQFKKGIAVIKEVLGDNDRSLKLSKENIANLNKEFAKIDEGTAKRIKTRADDKKATEAAAAASVKLSTVTGRTAQQDEAAADAAEKLTRAKESLAKAHRRVEDAVFDLADAEDDLRETEFREGTGSEAADKARREVERRRLSVADAQAAVAREVRDVAEANKKAAELIAVGLDNISTAVDKVAAAIPAALSAFELHRQQERDFANAAFQSPASVPVAGVGSLAPGAVGAGGLQGATINLNVSASNPAEAAAVINRDLDWLTRGGGVT